MILKTELQSAPLDLVTAVIEKAQANFEDMGATISITGDFDAFHAVDRDGALVFGGYNPGTTNATRGVSVVVSVDGVAVATGAAGLFETYERSMADLIHEIGIYQSPSDHVTLSGDCLDWLSSVTGRVMYIGGVWVRKDHRKTRLSHTVVPLVPLITAAIAAQVWRAEHMVSLVENAIVTEGIADRYRAWFARSGAMWRLNGRDVPMALAYTAPIQAIMDAKGFMRQGMEYLQTPLSRSANSGLSPAAA